MDDAEHGDGEYAVLDGDVADYAVCDMAGPTDLWQNLLAELGPEHGEALFDHLDNVQFWIKDRVGRYLRVNRALLLNYGFSDASAILGKTDQELFPPHLASRYVEDDRAALAGRPVHDRIELVARPDHSTGWHVTNKIPLRARSGRVVATAGITRDLNLHSASGEAFSTLQPVFAQLRAEFDQPLRKTQLAALLGQSVRSLERRFLAACGLSLLAYQRRLRLHHACQLLVTTHEPITAVALASGYSDHSHFTREFRKAFGVAPRLYRQRWYGRSGPADPAGADA